MSKVIPVSKSVQIIPNGYTGASNISGSTSSYPYSNAYNTADNTSYARLTPTRNTTWTIYFTFASPSPAIPSDATLTGITARFKAAPSNTTRITAATAQLCVGTTAKGSSTSFKNSTTASVRTISTGSISNWSISDLSNLRIKLTGTRNNTNTNTYIYMYGADVTITYTVNETAYEITVTNETGHGTVAPMTGEATEGTNYSLTFTHETSGTRPYQVLDNNVDVTSQLTEVSGQASSYTVATASGASYGFTQSGSSWVSNNKGVNSSAAVSVITLTIRNNATVTIDATASSEADYDYGYLSEIGETFSTSASAESSYKWRGAGTEYSTVNYGTLSPGTYQIYAKFYKDQYTASNDDTFTFKVNISETIPEGGSFTYTINSIQTDHSIQVFFIQPVYYNISGTIASGLSISPSLPQSVIKEDNISFTITPTLPGTITVRDNNVITGTYIIDPNDISNVLYTINNVQADHTLNITFVETAKYTISGTAASSLSVSPSLPIQKYAGADTTLTITPANPGIITVIDNEIETATYVIARGDIHNVTYDIFDLQTNHVLSINFEAAQQYQISGTLDSGLSISPTLPQSAYTGEDISFTITPNTAGTIIVYDNNVETASYAIPRDNIHSVTYEIISITEAHTLNIILEPVQQFTVSGTISAELSISPSLPQTLYTGDNLALTITPSAAGVIRVYDNEAEAATYEIPTSDIGPVIYNINAINDSHVLNIVYEALPTFTISASIIAPGITLSPSLPITAYLGETKTITITPNAAGTITVIDNDQEVAIHYILPEDIHSVTYTISNIAADHGIEIKFSELPEFTATATLSGSGTLSQNSITDYAGREITFTVSGVPSSNILIITNNGENVSKKATKDGTIYTYIFTLVKNTTIQFTSKVPSNVTVNATIDTFGTINPTTTTIQEGSEYTLQITPTDYQTTATAPLSVSDNYEEVIDEVYAKKDTASPTLTATSQTNSGISSGTSYLSYCIGRTAENPYNSTSNCYANSTGYAIYSFDVSSIPSDATIVSVSCKVNGHLEYSSIQSNRFCRVQLYANTTAKGTVQNFPSTSNTTMTLDDVGTWTRSEVSNIKLRMEVGYYGGLVCGISLTIEYEINQIRYYYTTTVYEEKTINVKYKPDFYVKVNRQWIGRTLTSMLPKIGGLRKHVKKLYVKINGEWKSVD